MGIGKNVKKYRTALGMDQKTLASKLGVTAGAISNYENDVSSPKEEVLYKMFEVFNVTPDELFAGCYTETKKAPASEDAGEGRVSLDTSTRALVAMGLIREGDQLSDDDLSFIGHIMGLLNAWFAEKDKQRS